MTHSNRAQFILGVLLIATLIPAVWLTYLQYQALSDLRQQTRQALVENLQQRLIETRTRMETDFLAWPRRALLGDEIHDWLQQGDLQRIHALSESARRVCPYVSLFFAYQFSYTSDQATIWTFRPTPQPWRMSLSTNDPAEAHIRDLVPQIVPNTSHFYALYADVDGEPHQVFFHLCDTEPTVEHDNAVGYVGFAVPTRVLADQYFPTVLQEHLTYRSSPNSVRTEEDFVVAVADETGRIVSQNNLSAEGSFVVQETFGGHDGILPGWALQVGFSGGQGDGIYSSQPTRGIGITFATAGLMLLAIIAIGVSATRQIHISSQKSEFVASVSHELRTPLALIQGYIETLRLNRLRKDEDRQEYLRIVEAEVQRLSTMIDSILESSKIDADLKLYRPEPTNVRQIIEKTVERFSYELEKEGVKLDSQIEGSDLVALVDRGSFSAAVLNLLSNAVKYSKGVRHIELKVKRLAGQISVSVTDHGIGIPKHEQRWIFRKFYRVESELGKLTQGAGLGLALVKHFAEGHGGSVNVYSEPGKGSTFTILLPAVAGETVDA